MRRISKRSLRLGGSGALLVLTTAAAVGTLLDVGPQTVPTWVFLVVVLLAAFTIVIVVSELLSQRKDLGSLEQLGRRHLKSEASWEFYKSRTVPDTWDSTVETSRKIRVYSESLASMTFAFNRNEGDHDGDAYKRNTPSVELTKGERPGGTVELMQPHSSQGARFAFDVVFRPPLRRGDEVTIDFRVNFFGDSFATREQVVDATKNSNVRDYEWSGSLINYPTDSTSVKVFLPDDLGARPNGPRVTVGGVDDPIELARLYESGGYKAEHSERDGVKGWLLSLVVKEPRLRASYSVTWIPPSFVDLRSSGDQDAVERSKIVLDSAEAPALEGSDSQIETDSATKRG